MLARLGSIASILAATMLSFAAPSFTAPAAPSDTEVVFFTPSIPAGPPRDGSCWTRSIALDRPGVWRCMVGNEIHDPCFQAPPRENELVCDANPASGKTGFVLKLSKPLPAQPAPSTWPSAWILKLADGSICEPFTGTRPAVNGEPAQWYCVKRGVEPSPATNSLVTQVHPGKPWVADRFAESAATGNPATAARRIRAETIPVLKVWQ